MDWLANKSLPCINLHQNDVLKSDLVELTLTEFNRRLQETQEDSSADVNADVNDAPILKVQFITSIAFSHSS